MEIFLLTYIDIVAILVMWAEVHIAHPVKNPLLTLEIGGVRLRNEPPTPTNRQGHPPDMLLEAWLLVCLSVSPDMCVEIRDTRGPYPTEEQCKQRIVEMETFVRQQHLFPLDISWRCKSVSENNDESTTPDTQEKGLDPATGAVPRVAI